MPAALSLSHKEPYVYKLHLQGENKLRSIRSKTRDGEICEFDLPVRQMRCPKLYVLRNEKKEVLYVGYADRHIGRRLYNGLKPNTKNGYHGYGWMNEAEVELLVWVFEAFGTNEKENKDYKRLIECIEAEVVFHVRSEMKRWPEFQQEVHFGNYQSEEVRKVADEIWAYLNKDNHAIS